MSCSSTSPFSSFFVAHTCRAIFDTLEEAASAPDDDYDVETEHDVLRLAWLLSDAKYAEELLRYIAPHEGNSAMSELVLRLAFPSIPSPMCRTHPAHINDVSVSTLFSLSAASPRALYLAMNRMFIVTMFQTTPQTVEDTFLAASFSSELCFLVSLAVLSASPSFCHVQKSMVSKLISAAKASNKPGAVEVSLLLETPRINDKTSSLLQRAVARAVADHTMATLETVVVLLNNNTSECEEEDSFVHSAAAVLSESDASRILFLCNNEVNKEGMCDDDGDNVIRRSDGFVRVVLFSLLSASSAVNNQSSSISSRFSLWCRCVGIVSEDDNAIARKFLSCFKRDEGGVENNKSSEMLVHELVTDLMTISSDSKRSKNIAFHSIWSAVFLLLRCTSSVSSSSLSSFVLKAFVSAIKDRIATIHGDGDGTLLLFVMNALDVVECDVLLLFPPTHHLHLLGSSFPDRCAFRRTLLSLLVQTVAIITTTTLPQKTTSMLLLLRRVMYILGQTHPCTSSAPFFSEDFVDSQTLISRVIPIKSVHSVDVLNIIFDAMIRRPLYERWKEQIEKGSFYDFCRKELKGSDWNGSGAATAKAWLREAASSPLWVEEKQSVDGSSSLHSFIRLVIVPVFSPNVLVMGSGLRLKRPRT